uniref:Uncharacterized protein n=1 Tax=Fagus sylvatica TaxID=28930 RepID=A0A2N9GPU5_FAGSY
MCKDGAEVLEALAPGGVFFEEQVERLGALVRLSAAAKLEKAVWRSALTVVARSDENSPDLVRSREISPDLVRSRQISVISSTAPPAPPTDCTLV